jgi:hypothetical protein
VGGSRRVVRVKGRVTIGGVDDGGAYDARAELCEGGKGYLEEGEESW